MPEGLSAEILTDWRALQARLEGAVIRREDPRYVLANKQFAAGQTLPVPDALIRCRGTDDVRRALSFLRDRGLEFAVRSGGHCFADFSSSQTAVIDLAEMNAVQVDHEGGRVRLQPGALAADVSAALAPGGRIVPTGGCPWVGMGGLALAGGFGFLGRMLGLVTDQVEHLQVLTADDGLIDVTADSHADLLWALRGGGTAGLGLVTALTLRTAPLPEVTVVRGAWPLSEAAALLEQWQHWAPAAGASLNLEMGLSGPDDPDIPAAVELFGVVLGPITVARDGVARVKAWLGGLARELKVWSLAPSAAAEYLVGLRDRGTGIAWQPCRPYPATGFHFTHSDFFEGPMSRPMLDECVANFAADRQYAQCRELEFVPWGGAYAFDQPLACFPHRKPRVLVRHTAVNGSRATPEMRDASRQWVAASRGSLQAAANGHVYAGYADPSLAAWPEAYYGQAWNRLREVKRRYDPDQVFRHAQSIPPA